MWWSPLFLVLFFAVASGEHFQAWKTDTEYVYLVRGRTLAALHDVDEQYTGIMMKAVLTVHPKSEDTLQARISKPQYAQIHTKLPDGWKSEIPDSMVEYKQLPLSDKVFEVKMKNGMIRDMIVDKDVPTWDVNILKSIVGQFQVDTLGANLIPSKHNYLPEEDNLNAMYKTMEDSVGGKCEVMYSISPFPEYSLRERQESLLDKEQNIDIIKTKNYTNCEQRMSNSFGMTGGAGKEPYPKENSESMSRSSISRIIITGDLKTFTIRSSVTTDQVIMSPTFYEDHKGMVSSRMNMTLVKMGPMSSGPWSTPINPESTGNLVYNFNNPFAMPNEGRRPGLPFSDSNLPTSEGGLRSPTSRGSDDDSFESSMEFDSLEITEQQKSFLQPKPSLNEAPAMPLLPFFIGYNGRSLHKTPNIDPIGTAKILARQIGSDLQNPNSMHDEQTLEKFTILVRLLRTMSTQQISEVQQELYVSSNFVDPHDDSQNVRANTWVAFRDAIAHVGTGPALVTIKNLIKEKKLQGMEAAMVLSVLCKTARTPTSEYMDEFFKMVTMPETMNQVVLNSTAMVSFAELVRFSQVDENSAHNRYPVHSFGRFSPKNNPTITRVFIPYMAEQMKKAIENKELSKSHVYIRAFGALAHPQMLAVYEPYLEGKMMASTFQRLLMVISMNKLASMKPDLVRGVLYKIYQNTAENHRLRCAAVGLLMTTNPPTSMLQRMAEFTHHDISKNVNAAVKSAIESASELEGTEYQDLATKARNVLPLLNKDNYGSEYSEIYLFDDFEDSENFAGRIDLTQIGSDNSFTPQALYGHMKMMYGDFIAPKLDMGAMVSSVKDLVNVWKWQTGDAWSKSQPNNMELSVDKIRKMLNIVSEKTDLFEGAVWWNDMYNNKFLSFDKNTLLGIPHLLKDMSASFTNGHTFNVATFTNYEVTISFPMESGLPFLYTFDMPNLVKCSGSIKGNNHLPKTIDGSLDIGLLHARELRPRLGFVTPFDHQQYMAGLNLEHQIYVPIRMKALYDNTQNQAKLTLEPLMKNEQIKVVGSSLIPFTTMHDIFEMSPIMKDKKTHLLIRGEPLKTSNPVSSHAPGFTFQTVLELDTNSKSKVKLLDDEWKENPLIRFFLGEDEGKIDYRKVDMLMIPNPLNTQSITFTVAVDTLHDDTTKHISKPTGELKATAMGVKSKLLNDPQRRKQMLKEVTRGIVAADGFVVDLGVDVPGEQMPLQIIWTIAYANSMIDEKSRGQVFGKMSIGDSSLESCGALEALSPKVPIIDMLVKGTEETANIFDIEVRGGDVCEEGGKIRATGKQMQTEDYRQILNEQSSTKQCSKDMLEGSISTPACLELSERLSFMDNAEMDVEFESENELLKHVGVLIDMIGGLDNAVVKRHRSLDSEENRLKLAMKLNPWEKTATFSFAAHDSTVYFSDIEMGSLVSYLGTVNPDLSPTERLNHKLNDLSPSYHTCVMDFKIATTFDQATYPINLGQCWHVALITDPISNEERMESPWRKDRMDQKISVVVKDTVDKKKEVKMSLATAKIDLKVLNNQPVLSVDHKEIDLKKYPEYMSKDGDLVNFVAALRPDNSIRVESSRFGVDLVYTGRELRMKVSSKYRSGIRGLCGNFDGEPDNDFVSPKNCITRKTDLFVASYALPLKECTGPSQELSDTVKMNEANCERRVIRPANVIRKLDTERGNHHSMNDHIANNRCITVRTRIIEEPNQMCFSLRPLPTCATGCQVVRSKSKTMPMYCVGNGATANGIAERIRKGANPDFRQKTVSKLLSFDMPVACTAA